MTDLILQAGISNLCITLLLAIAAWCVHRSGKQPLLAHLLWLIVLIKVVTPPLVTVPIVPLPTAQSETAPENEPAALNDAAMPAHIDATLPALDLSSTQPFEEHIAPVEETSADAASFSLQRTLVLIWIIGSVIALAWSLVRIIRFNSLLRSDCTPAPTDIQQLAHTIAQRFNLRRTPSIECTSARLSPMVWWVGGRVRVILPLDLIEDVPRTELRWMIAHELAHVSRKDHLVRWLEWLACVGFWWNPVAWCARHFLRINEEICCDALVLERFESQPQPYAHALMNVIEYLANPAIRPPAMASELNSGGFLERRFTMIMSDKKAARTPRWLIGGAIALAVGLMPLGVAYGQAADHEAVGKRLKNAVAEGELSPEHARAMMQMLRDLEASAAHDNHDKHDKHLHHELAHARELIHKAVESGTLSKRDAEVKLHKLHKALAEHDAHLEMREVEMQRVHERIRNAVESGQLSREDAELKVMELERRIAAEHERAARDRMNAADTNKDQARLEAQIKALIEAGRISEEEAFLRLRDVRTNSYEQAMQQRDAEAHIEDAKRQIEAAIKAGKLSKEDAARAMARLKHELESNLHRSRDLHQHQQKLHEVHQALEEAVKAGKLSKEEAAAKIDAIKQQLHHESMKQGHDQRISAQHQLEQAAAQIKAAVEAGRLSELDASRKLHELHNAMKEMHAHELELKKRASEARERIQEGVDAGEIDMNSAKRAIEQLQQRVEELERRLRNDREHTRVERDDHGRLRIERERQHAEEELQREREHRLHIERKLEEQRRRADNNDQTLTISTEDFGLDAEDIKRIENAYVGAGIPREQISDVFAATLYFIHACMNDSEGFEKNHNVVYQLKAMDLTDAQTALLFETSRRIASAVQSR